MTTSGYLGIDAGTQGLSVIFTDKNLNVLGVGEGSYDMLPGLPPECYEQNPDDWTAALQSAMHDLRSQLPAEHQAFEVLAIGISGQMHGEVLAGSAGNSVGPARLWCDSRNEDEGFELTEKFGVKMPKRATAARWLWTVRNQPDKARAAANMTTPAGWISFCLTGQWTLGIGDASGMFPIDQDTMDYNTAFLDAFDRGQSDSSCPSLAELLPAVRLAGEDAGVLHARAANMLGLPGGIPVAPAEGDQPAAMAGSLIGDAGMVSISFGTSVCANSVGDRPFQGVSAAVDHFCAVDGKPINMVWLRNGTTYMNRVVQMFADQMSGDPKEAFQAIIDQALAASPDCDGILALPFMDDEPGLGVSRGGTALMIGLSDDNARPGNLVKAALLSTMFNLRIGSEVLDEQGYPRSELVLTGGLTKTPATSQILADVFQTPVTLLESAEEGTAWGAALMAKFRHQRIEGETDDWASFLRRQAAGKRTQFTPNREVAAAYGDLFQRYKQLVALQPELDRTVGRANS